MQSIRNIGLFAHVDAGKTTLSEQLLRASGAIRSLGYVDQGTAHTDQLDIERRRGISIKATCVSMRWKDTRINLIDTPGHADFAAEVERSLWALDGAVLLISAAEDIKPQTEMLARAFEARQLPYLIFFNKTDSAAADRARALDQAKKRLSPHIAPLEDDEALCCLLADFDEKVLNDYLEGRVPDRDTLLARIAPLAREGRLHPALYGSALRGEGIEPLLDAIALLLPPPAQEEARPVSGVVFALEEAGGAMGRAAYVRLFSGRLKNRDSVVLSRPDEKPREAKISQIRSLSLGGRGEDLGALEPGGIARVMGLGDVRAGDALGEARALGGGIARPLIMVKVTPCDEQDRPRLREALGVLSAEDPLLSVEELEGESHIRALGLIQLEVIAETLRERFHIETRFGPREVIYRETIARPAEGFYAYTMPKPCWAVIKFMVEPLPTGSGVTFESVTPVREILPRYQNQVRQAIPLAVRQGMLGWQVDDVKITLLGGEHHLVHTHPLDFIVCTPIAFMDALRRGGSRLLEPILDMRILSPADCLGRLLGEINLMRGEVTHTQTRDELICVEASVPVATSMDFSARLAALTSGRGALSAELGGYRPCPDGFIKTCPRRSVNPLDTARYILAARSALEGGIFDL